MKITIETIDHAQQRYPTVGDWRFIDGDLVIRVSKMSDWRYEALVGLHELIEAVLCKQRGITEEVVDAFDIAHADRLIARSDLYEEPGDNFRCPYYSEHQKATDLEEVMAGELGVDWKSYDKEVESL